jgi:uncharacterized protein YacL
MVSITINKDDSDRIVVALIYTIVSTKDLGRIKSPLDNLKKGVRKTKSKPVLSFVEGLVLTIIINNRNTTNNIPFGEG